MSILLVNANSEQIPLADNSVHACVTSPPYYGLRKYNVDGDAEIGLEDTPEAYLARMVAVFREVRRVLRDDGVCWVNMGDSYANNPGNGRGGESPDGGIPHRSGIDKTNAGYKPLDLMNIPARLVLALQADGWYHRSTIIWSKPNPMPESVSGTRWERHKVKVGQQKIIEQGRYEETIERGGAKKAGITPDWLAEWSDCPGCSKCEPNGGLVLRRGSWRPTTSHEYIFMLTKTDSYFADGEAVREPHTTKEGLEWMEYGRGGKSATGQSLANRSAYPVHPNPSKLDGTNKQPDGRSNFRTGNMREDGTHFHPSGRNIRTVWDFPTQPYPGSHFATYPEELPRRCLKASISERGCCPKCGAQWARIIDNESNWQERKANGAGSGSLVVGHNTEHGKGMSHDLYARRSSKGFLPTCSCNCDTSAPPIVLDIFCGSGTTGIVAREMGAHFIGLDLSYPYLHEQARSRLELDRLDAWGKGKKDGAVITDLPLFKMFGVEL